MPARRCRARPPTSQIRTRMKASPRPSKVLSCRGRWLRQRWLSPSRSERMLLAGDVGGTKTALAVFSPEEGPRAPIAEKIFPSGEYPSLEAIAKDYLGGIDLPVTRACFAVAGPVSGGKASLTNLPWLVDGNGLGGGREL